MECQRGGWILMETYTKTQFIRTLSLRGIAGEKKGEKYTADHPKDIYTEDDVADVYYLFHREPVGRIIHGLAADGQDMFAPGKDKSCHKRWR